MNDPHKKFIIVDFEKVASAKYEALKIIKEILNLWSANPSFGQLNEALGNPAIAAAIPDMLFHNPISSTWRGTATD
jgi:hypothetical protein